MPIKTQNNLPAKAILENENIFVMDEDRAISQNIRPLKIAILNLMPLKEETEVQLLRVLSNTPLQIDIILLQTASYQSTHTSQSHLNMFYQTFDDIKDQKLDGMIITGAPVEFMDFEQVEYWEELTNIMEWTKTNVTSTFHICWGAQAGLYYHFGVRKIILPKKVSGIYRHRVNNRKVQLVRGFDDVFLAPHSRNTESSPEDIRTHEELVVLAESDEVGDLIVMTRMVNRYLFLDILNMTGLPWIRNTKGIWLKDLIRKNHIITTLMIILITDRYLHGEQHLTAFTVTGLTIMYIRRHLMT